MPRRKGARSDLMIEALSRGGQLAQQGQEAVLRQREAGAEDIQRGVGAVASMFHDREQRAEEHKFQREEGAKERSHRAELQAQETGSRERIAGAELARRKEELEAENVHRGIQRTGQNGQQGGPVQRSPGPEAGPAQPQKPVGEGKGAFDPRMQKMQAEMARGLAQSARGKEQMDKEHEQLSYGDMRNAPTFELTEGRKAQEAAKIAREESLAEQRFNRQQLAVQKHSLAEWKADKEAMEEAKKSLSSEFGITRDQQLLSDAKSGKLLTADATWSELKRDYGDSPDSGIQQELASKQFGPSLSRAVNNRIAASGIKMAAAIGEIPDNMDIGNPIWQQFLAKGPVAAQMIAESNAEPLFRIQNFADKTRILHKLAANLLMIEGATRAQQSRAQEAGRASVINQPRTQASVANRSPAAARPTATEGPKATFGSR